MARRAWSGPSGLGLLLAGMALTALAGCSLALDPEECSSDGECANGAVCQDGICIGGDDPELEVGVQLDGGGDPVDMAEDDPDMAAPDEGVDLMPDATPDVAPPDPQPPQCTLGSTPDDGTLTGEPSAELRFSVLDPDTPSADIAVTLDGEAVELEGDGLTIEVELVEGDNRFVFAAEDPDGLGCMAEVEFTLDTVAPSLIELTPPDGASVLTNDADFPVRGAVDDLHFDSAAPDALVISVDGAPSAAPIIWDGAAFQVDVGLEEGDNALQVIAADLLGNTSEPVSFTVQLDTTPPLVIIDAPPPNDEVFLDRIEVQGRVQDDRQPLPRASYTIRISADGEAPVSIEGIADDEGAFSRRVPLFEGENTLTVIGRDTAGNAGESSRTITRLAAEPCIDLVAPLDGSFTRNARVDVNGTVCPAVDRVEVQVGEARPIDVPPALGRFQAAIDLPGPGAHMITAVAYSANGEAEASVSITLDQSAPDVRISEPEEGACTNVRELRVCGSVDDPESGIAALEVSAGNAPVDADIGVEGGIFCQAVRPPEGGEVEVVVTATNRANSVGEASVEIRVDREAPVICLTREGACFERLRPWFGVNGIGRVELEGLVEWGICGIRTLTLDGAPINADAGGVFAAQRAFDDGNQDIELRVVDLAGNEALLPFAFRVDGTSPVLSDFDPGQAFFTVEDEVLLQVTASDAASGVIRAIIDDVEVFGLDPNLPEGRDSEIVGRRVALVEGLNTFEVEAFDLVGNSVVETIEVRRDTTPPEVAITSPSPDRAVPVPIVVTGTIVDGPDGSGPATVTVNGQPAVIDLETGTWRADGVELEPPVAQLVVEATDVVGNAIEPPLTQRVTVRQYGSNDSVIDGLDYPGPIGWMGVMDVELDGHLDIAVLPRNAEDGAVIFRQDAEGRFTRLSAADVGLPENIAVRFAEAGDFDADGQVDLLIVGVDRSVMALGNGQGGFALAENTGLPAVNAPTGLAVGDITRNRQLDVLVLAGPATRLLLSNGDGTFEREALDNLGLGAFNQFAQAQFVDLDDDGVLDAVGYGPGGSGLWIGDRLNPFAAAGPERGFGDRSGRMLLPIDGDRDGTLDLLLADGAQAGVLLNDGAGNFVDQPLGLAPWRADAAGAARIDVDGDARDDLVVWGGGPLQIWQAGDGFAPADPLGLGIDAGPEAGQVVVRDLDRDGDEDLLVATPQGVRFIRSNLTAVDPNYRAIELEVLRALAPPGGGPYDAWGALIQVDLVGGDDLAPERVVPARATGSTVITMGVAEAIGYVVQYVDLGGIGQSTRSREDVPAGDVSTIYAREPID